MTAADTEAVLVLERMIFAAPWTPGMFLDELSAPGRSYLLAEQDGEVVGYGGVMVVDGDAHIMTIAVVPEQRRRGLATRLMLALIDEALRSGAAHLTLEMRVSNDSARALYEKFGFAPVGVRPRYYGDEDALVMWALDADSEEYLARLGAIRQEAA
jgi:ribosomal-protein-alanine N-acetyltransferase